MATVDYTCRRLTPWEELLNQQPDEKKSLFLDYIFPFLPINLWRAIGFQHWSVVISLSGFMLLKLITVLSTGLLVLSPTLLSNSNAQFQTSIISGRSYCRGANQTCNTSNPSIDDVLEYWGIIQDRLQYPEGTSSSSLFELVRIPPGLPEGAVITTTVPGFYPTWTCKHAVVHNNSGFPPLTGSESFEQGWYESSGFDISVGNQTWRIAAEITFCDAALSQCPPRGRSTTEVDGDNFVWLIVIDVRYKQTIAPTLNSSALQGFGTGFPDLVNVTQWSAHIAETTALMCYMNYTIESTRLRIDTAHKNTSRYLEATGPLTHTGDHLVGYTNYDLYLNDLDLLGSEYPAAFPDTSQFGASIFDLMAQANIVQDNATLLDPEVLMNVSAQTINILATQMASEFLQVNGTRTVTGTLEYSENRLHVKPLSLWMMISGFAVIYAITFLLLLARPQARPTQDPASIASCACILASNRDLRLRLVNLGMVSDTGLRQEVCSPSKTERADPGTSSESPA